MKNTIKLSLLTALLITSNIKIASAMSQGRLPPEELPAEVTVAYTEGDIIFIQSQTAQAKALREATRSVWTHVGIIVKNKSNKWAVAEAIGPLKVTPIADFIGRSKNKTYKILRFRHFDQKTMLKSLYASLPKYNKPYDIYFEFNQDKIYCSELTYLVFKEITGFDLGRIQKMKEMQLSGPYVQALIKKRFTETGREFDLEELIITPVSQLLDENLILIKEKL